MTITSAPFATRARAARRRGFSEVIGGALTRRRVRTVQVNVGKRCNQACVHCHVDAGPKRTEVMALETVNRLLELLDQPNSAVTTLDLTGGAPELLPDFRRLVTTARGLGLRVIDRCNLTVLSEPGQADTAQFLADNHVEVVASMPCYTRALVEKQRGKGVFALSIAGLRQLNAVGYGQPGSGLILNLVYNPNGARLPPAQAALEADYKERLHADFGVVFSALFTITNMPIARFHRTLARTGELDGYEQLLYDSHNPATVADLMCRDQISVSWQGGLHDCDFNQMLDMPAGGRSIFEIDAFEELSQDFVRVAEHCFGCTAGAGSSCGGALG